MTRTVLRGGLITAMVACGALAAAAGAAQATEKIFARVHNNTGHTIHVRTQAACGTSREGEWYLGPHHIDTLRAGEAIESEKGCEIVGTWASWIHAYTETTRPLGCQLWMQPAAREPSFRASRLAFTPRLCRLGGESHKGRWRVSVSIRRQRIACSITPRTSAKLPWCATRTDRTISASMSHSRRCGRARVESDRLAAARATTRGRTVRPSAPDASGCA